MNHWISPTNTIQTFFVLRTGNNTPIKNPFITEYSILYFVIFGTETLPSIIHARCSSISLYNEKMIIWSYLRGGSPPPSDEWYLYIWIPESLAVKLTSALLLCTYVDRLRRGYEDVQVGCSQSSSGVRSNDLICCRQFYIVTKRFYHSLDFFVLGRTCTHIDRPFFLLAKMLSRVQVFSFYYRG